MGTTLASLVTNKRRVSALKSLGIVTVGDALTYYPFRVTEPVPLRAIREAAPGQQMAFAAVIRDMRVCSRDEGTQEDRQAGRWLSRCKRVGMRNWQIRFSLS